MEKSLSEAPVAVCKLPGGSGRAVTAQWLPIPRGWGGPSGPHLGAQCSALLGGGDGVGREGSLLARPQTGEVLGSEVLGVPCACQPPEGGLSAHWLLGGGAPISQEASEG